MFNVLFCARINLNSNRYKIVFVAGAQVSLVSESYDHRSDRSRYGGVSTVNHISTETVAVALGAYGT